jgi:hypothetical protein
MGAYLKRENGGRKVEGVDSGIPKRSDGRQPLSKKKKGPLVATKDARAKNRASRECGLGNWCPFKQRYSKSRKDGRGISMGKRKRVKSRVKKGEKGG